MKKPAKKTIEIEREEWDMPIREIKGNVLRGIDLWRALKEKGFPQGGSGNWLLDGNEKVYIPHPSEIYQLFIADPEGWEDMSAVMAREWLARRV